jgi:hypothetical protein
MQHRTAPFGRTGRRALATVAATALVALGAASLPAVAAGWTQPHSVRAAAGDAGTAQLQEWSSTGS